MASKRYHAEQWQQQAKQLNRLASLYVISGNEELLHIEASDALRAAAQRLGYDERQRIDLDAQADWSEVIEACQSMSLFGGQRLVELSLPTGRPGRTGGEHLQKLGTLLADRDDITVLVLLPYLNQSSLKSKWAQALQKNAQWIDAPQVRRGQLPQWIQNRLERQNQSCDHDTALWLSEQVEGHLLAAHQEVLKLGLLYPTGTLSLDQVQEAVLNVARYNVFDLRDALLAGNGARALRIVQGLQAEGVALPLVLWVISEEVRLLAQLSAARLAGQSLDPIFRAYRVFGPRQKLLQQALHRSELQVWTQSVAHAYDIDQAIKGFPVAQRLSNPWAEIQRLCIRIAQATA
ncbi:MAG TPA: DNA polymerase III subunit delta [Paenalcaligenes sp.]|nr:DNA polymerase III subunit delta [Paenalcaligenes sp.]